MKKRDLTFDNDVLPCCNHAKKKKILWLFTSVNNKKCLKFASILGGCEVCFIFEAYYRCSTNEELKDYKLSE